MSALLDQWAAQASEGIEISPPFSRDVSLNDRGSVFRTARDSQRAKVYRWERALAGIVPAADRTVSQSECHDLLHRVWQEQAPVADVGRPPSLRFRKRMSALGTAHGLYHRIDLLDVAGSIFPFAVHGQRIRVLLHEIAHLLTPGVGHGPQWARQFAFLLRVYAEAPIPYVVGMADKHRVKGALLADLQSGFAR